MLRVRVGSLIFHGFAEDGFILETKGFQGWDDGVDIRRNNVDRPAAHGAYDIPGFLDARVVSLSGWCYADSEPQLGHLRSQFTGTGADGESLRVVVDHHGLTLWADARLASKPMFDVDGGRASARFQMQLWFADPRKFGEARTFASGVPAFHYGNFPATPILTVTGSEPSGYTVTGPAGKQFIVTRALVSGHPHTIDMATGLLSVDGVVVFGGVSRADTWSIPAGGQVTVTISGSAQLSRRVLDTFI